MKRANLNRAKGDIKDAEIFVIDALNAKDDHESEFSVEQAVRSLKKALAFLVEDDPPNANPQPPRA